MKNTRASATTTPAPGAWTLLDGQRVKLGPVTPTTDDTLRPGEVQAGRREVRVGTATTDVVLGTVQPTGRKPMAAADWARGTTIEPGTVLA